MFWIGLFSGIVFYLIFTLIAVAIAKKKVKKKQQKEKDYQYIINNQMEQNKNNRKSQN